MPLTLNGAAVRGSLSEFASHHWPTSVGASFIMAGEEENQLAVSAVKRRDSSLCALPVPANDAFYLYA